MEASEALLVPMAVFDKLDVLVPWYLQHLESMPVREFLAQRTVVAEVAKMSEAVLTPHGRIVELTVQLEHDSDLSAQNLGNLLEPSAGPQSTPKTAFEGCPLPSGGLLPSQLATPSHPPLSMSSQDAIHICGQAVLAAQSAILVVETPYRRVDES